MPTMILTLAWLLATTTHPAAVPAPAPAATIAAAAATPDQPILLGSWAPGAADPAGWLLFESDNDEETDDEAGISSPTVGWPAPRTPFGIVASNPHPTVLPRSALRSVILRC